MSEAKENRRAWGPHIIAVRNVAISLIAVALLFQPGPVAARHADGCLPGYRAYSHIVDELTALRFGETRFIVLEKRPGLQTELWLSGGPTRSWSIVARGLRGDCARITDAGSGWYIDRVPSPPGQPL